MVKASKEIKRKSEVYKLLNFNFHTNSTANDKEQHRDAVIEEAVGADVQNTVEQPLHQKVVHNDGQQHRRPGAQGEEDAKCQRPGSQHLKAKFIVGRC